MESNRCSIVLIHQFDALNLPVVLGVYTITQEKVRASFGAVIKIDIAI